MKKDASFYGKNLSQSARMSFGEITPLEKLKAINLEQQSIDLLQKPGFSVGKFAADAATWDEDLTLITGLISIIGVLQIEA
jgi:hypothetical protein